MLALTRALLIQDVSEYVETIRPYLVPLMDQYIHTGISEEGVLQWIIEEELELIYGLFTRGHKHNHQPHQLIHSLLNSSMPWTVSVITRHFIRAPKLYDPDEMVRVSLKHRDLHISYFQQKQRFQVLRYGDHPR